jgi:hypothetical protein
MDETVKIMYRYMLGKETSVTNRPLIYFLMTSQDQEFLGRYKTEHWKERTTNVLFENKAPKIWRL